MAIVRTIAYAALTITTSVALAYALFGLGFVACTTPQATAWIGGTFSGWDHAVFPEEDMAQIAEGVRSFSIEGTDAEALESLVRSALEQTRPELVGAADAAVEAFSAGAGSGTTSALLERYSFPDDALSHLQDCTPIFTAGRISTGVVGAFGLVGAAALWLLCGRRRAGGAILGGALLVVAVLVGLGVWAALDFDGLFAWMHTLFFAQGTWTFPSDSLLISLFPEAFWAAMAGLWVAASLVFALIVGLIGKILSK